MFTYAAILTGSYYRALLKQIVGCSFRRNNAVNGMVGQYLPLPSCLFDKENFSPETR